MFHLDKYLERLGIGGVCSMAQVHRAHVLAIPFENLDSHRGVPVSLEPAALARKLLDERRGGYCFEQNLLLSAALTALGATVEPMLARVRIGRAPDRGRPRTHLVLRVRDEAGVWLADAGFGNGTLLEPVPFAPGGVHEQSGWRYRLVRDGAEHVLQLGDADGWTDLYGFVPEPVPPVDLETSNWFTCTHPRSPFVTSLMVTVHRPDGSWLALGEWDHPTLTERTPTATTVTEVSRADVPALLADRFGLPGFVLGPAGRIVPRA